MRTKNEVLAFTPLYTFSVISPTKNIQKSEPKINFGCTNYDNNITINLNRSINIELIKSLKNLKENCRLKLDEIF